MASERKRAAMARTALPRSSFCPGNKVIVAFAFLLFSASLCTARALADAIEYCPAGLAAPAQVVAPSVIGLQLESDGPRSVSGSLFVESNVGWYQADFSNVALAQTEVHGGIRGATYTRRTFRSSTLYVQLPTSAHVFAVFIAQAQATGDPDYGWDARGMVGCDSPPAPAPRVASSLVGEPAVTLSLPQASSLVLQAQPIAPPAGFTRDCSAPFAGVVQKSRPNLSFDTSSIGVVGVFGVYVRVAVSDSGGVDGAWVIASSGYPQLDNAVLALARRSTYAPAQSYCAPVRGYYDFFFRIDDNRR